MQALEDKRVLVLRQKEWAEADREETFELTSPPSLKGLGHEISRSLLKIFPMCATMCALVAGSICSVLSRLPESSSREDLFVGASEAVLICSLMISAFVVKYRPMELLDDIESQIRESMGDLQKTKAMVEKRFGVGADAVEKI
jgi:hypothetical protein